MKGIMAVTYAPKAMKIEEFELPIVKEDEFLLKVDMVSICGSDPKIFEGKIASPQKFPTVLGHEMVGHVDTVGAIAARKYGVKPGDRVTVEPYIQCGECAYCLSGNYSMCDNRRCYGVPNPINGAIQGAYATHMLVLPGSKVHRVKDGIPDEAACLSSVIGNGVRWSRTKGHVDLNDTVVINGAGAQGLSALIAARALGAGMIIVTGLTKDRKKFELARELGADVIVNVEKEDLYERVAELTGGRMADVVIEASGATSGIQIAPTLLRPLGRLMLAGVTGMREIPFITDWIINKELTVVGGLGQSNDVEAAVGIINSGRFPIEKMITHVFPLDKAADGMQYFMEGHEDCIKCALDCNI